MTTETETWYLKREDSPEGPLTLLELKERARSGQFTGIHALSTTGESPWTEATSVEELELHWVILPEGQPAKPPCHVLALRSLVEHGDVEPYWDIKHTPTGDTFEVVDALCSALLTENRVLETHLEAMTPLGEGSDEEEVVEDAVENLLRSLELKSQLLEDLRRTVLRVEAERDHERKQREVEHQQSVSRMDDLATHLEEMDEAMSDLTRKYRDLNDRYIRLRRQIPDADPS